MLCNVVRLGSRLIESQRGSGSRFESCDAMPTALRHNLALIAAALLVDRASRAAADGAIHRVTKHETLVEKISATDRPTDGCTNTALYATARIAR